MHTFNFPNTHKVSCSTSKMVLTIKPVGLAEKADFNFNDWQMEGSFMYVSGLIL